MKPVPPGIEIRPMRPGERERVLELLESAFRQRAVFERTMDFDAAYRPHDVLLALERERPLSCVQVFEKRIRLAGAQVALGGIGSVGTHPDHRHRGLASELVRRQSAELRRRGAVLGLLFSGRHTFYAPLGWIALELRQVVLRASRTEEGVDRGLSLRPAELPRDLPAVRSLYDAYCERLDGTTLRDETYWRGQLRYAGNPDERFTVAEERGSPVAYLRCVTLERCAAMEFARRQGAESALAALLCEAARAQGPLLLRLPPDPDLERALAACGARLDPLPDRSAMWRVLDRGALARIARGLPSDADDSVLLRALVSGRVHYWLSDRF